MLCQDVKGITTGSHITRFIKRINKYDSAPDCIIILERFDNKVLKLQLADAIGSYRNVVFDCINESLFSSTVSFGEVTSNRTEHASEVDGGFILVKAIIGAL